MKNEYSGFMLAEFMSTKDHVLFCLKRLIEERATTNQCKVKVIRFDNGSEFKNQGVRFLCDSEGIAREYSNPYEHQQNGEAEKANRTIIETARSMLSATSLPLSLFAEAVATAVFVRNRTSNKSTGDKTPFELFYGRKPDLSHMVKFGQEVYIKDHGRCESKFSPKTIVFRRWLRREGQQLQMLCSKQEGNCIDIQRDPSSSQENWRLGQAAVPDSANLLHLQQTSNFNRTRRHSRRFS